MNITPEDVLAAADVLHDVDEASDSLSIEDAVAYREAVTSLMAAARMTLALIDTQLVTTLESPREINGMRYEVKPSDGKWRPDHSKVAARVKQYALVDMETGEMRDAPAAVDRAMLIMEDLYVAKSTMPKVGALEKLGGTKKWDVAEQEPGKPALKTTPIIEAPE